MAVVTLAQLRLQTSSAASPADAIVALSVARVRQTREPQRLWPRWTRDDTLDAFDLWESAVVSRMSSLDRVLGPRDWQALERTVLRGPVAHLVYNARLHGYPEPMWGGPEPTPTATDSAQENGASTSGAKSSTTVERTRASSARARK
jgi:hypothetical protein